MNASTRGLKDGLRHIQAAHRQAAHLTFEQFLEEGRRRAGERHATEAGRTRYLYGWRQAGELSRSLFRLADDDLRGGQRKLEVARSVTRSVTSHLEPLVSWRTADERLHRRIVRAYESAARTQALIEEALRDL